MSIQDVLDNTDIDGFSSEDHSRIENVLRTVYAGSPSARAMLDKVVTQDKTLRIQYAEGKFETPFEINNTTHEFIPSFRIRIDLEYLKSFVYISPTGKGIQATPADAIVHELVHAIEGLSDGWTDGRRPTLKTDSDSDGPTVRFANSIYKELGIAERLSYAGISNKGDFTDGVEYTNGHNIDVAILGRDAHKDVDTSTNTPGTRDLLFGSEDFDNIFISGAGNDFLYGQGGTDILIGGSGNDYLSGGAQGDTLQGGSGVDTLDGGDGNDIVSYEGSDEFLWLDLAKETANLIQTSITPDGPSESSYAETVKNFENAIAGSGGSRLFGSDLSNTLTGGTGTDRLVGRMGDDTLEGGIGDDFLYGGYTSESPDDVGTDDGNDHLNGGPGNDTLDGGTGNDWAYYNDSDGELRLDLAAGQAALYERVFDTTAESMHVVGSYDHLVDVENIVGSGAVNWIYGNSGDNNLSGGTEDDHLFGRTGHDTLGGAEGTDELYGEADNDHLIGGPGNDTLNGGAGIDTADYDYSNGLLEVDLESGQGRFIVVYDDDGNALRVEDTDVLVDIENVIGSSGPSNIYGNELANVLDGFAGFNNLYGRGGNDTLWGGDDRNWLYGGDGEDILRGGDDTDWLDGEIGADTMQGFDGDDVYVVDQSEDTVIEFSGGGTDRIRTATISFALPDNVENLELLGDLWLPGIGNNADNIIAGNGVPNALFGGGGKDTIDGGGESDGLFGQNENDLIYGGAGPDKVYGGDGDDMLDGGDGNDILTGNIGSDAFVFTGSHGIDSVRDFDITVDHLEVAGGFWAIEMLDGTSDGFLDNRDTNISFGIPSRDDTYYPAYDGPPDEADAYGMNIMTDGGIIHLDNVFALTADDVWDLA